MHTPVNVFRYNLRWVWQSCQRALHAIPACQGLDAVVVVSSQCIHDISHETSHESWTCRENTQHIQCGQAQAFQLAYGCWWRSWPLLQHQKPLSSHAGNGGTLQRNQRSADLLFLSFTLSKILHIDGHCTTTEPRGQKHQKSVQKLDVNDGWPPNTVDALAAVGKGQQKKKSKKQSPTWKNVHGATSTQPSATAVSLPAIITSLTPHSFCMNGQGGTHVFLCRPCPLVWGFQQVASTSSWCHPTWY